MMPIFSTAMALLLQTAPQWAALPPTDGFVVGHQQTARNGSIEERIPQGETVHDWSRMITLIRLEGDFDPAAFSTQLSQRFVSDCAGGTIAPQRETVTPALEWVSGRVDCPINPQTNKPEVMFYRAFRGDGGMFMLQVAFRRLPDAKEAGWAEALLEGAVLCDAASANALCKR